MKILLMSIGSRGDCEPFLGVGEMLRERGNDIICAFPEQYRSLAEECGFDFCSLGTEFIDLLDSDVGRVAMGDDKGGFEKLSATIKLSKVAIPIQKRMIDLQHEAVEKVKPDCIIFHPKVTYALPWSLKTGGKIVMLSTVPAVLHEVKGRPTVGVNKNLGILNPLTYKLTNSATASTIMSAVKKYFPGEITKKQILSKMKKMKIFYTVSPSIFSRPNYWPDNAVVAGFWERNKTRNYTPSEELQNFFNSHKKIMLITFGSMVNSDPEGKTKLFLETLSECKIPAVINISGGGFAEPKEYDKNNIVFTKSIPYDWVFSKMYAVVHHGGAGTTHSALKAGCATMAIPHIADQPMWDDFIHALGAGPKGIAISKLKKDLLKEKLSDLFNNTVYKKSAETISASMKSEDYSNELYKFIIS